MRTVTAEAHPNITTPCRAPENHLLDSGWWSSAELVLMQVSFACVSCIPTLVVSLSYYSMQKQPKSRPGIEGLLVSSYKHMHMHTHTYVCTPHTAPTPTHSLTYTLISHRLTSLKCLAHSCHVSPQLLCGGS